MDERAISPVLGTGLLLVLTVLLAATMGTVLLGADTPDEPTTTRFSASANASAEKIAITHEGGASLDPDSLTVRVRIDGRSLDHQPPIPFFASTGFISGPTGPFNSATTGDWSAGQTGSFRLAATNDPGVTDGARVEITVSTESNVIATVETTAD